jgi:hypothetical protein
MSALVAASGADSGAALAGAAQSVKALTVTLAAAHNIVIVLVMFGSVSHKVADQAAGCGNGLTVS